MVSRLDYAGAITDHGAMYGFLDFYKKMKKAGKKPIIGMEAYVETLDGKKKGNHLILLAENKAGYRNLIKLSSAGFTNFYSKPHVSMKMLREHHEGIIATSACLKGAIPEALVEGSYDRAKEVAQTYIDIRAENFFIEIQRHGIEDEMRIEKTYSARRRTKCGHCRNDGLHYLMLMIPKRMKYCFASKRRQRCMNPT